VGAWLLRVPQVFWVEEPLLSEDGKIVL